MIDSTEIRKQVRVILSARRADDAPVGEGYLAINLENFFSKKIHGSEVALALQWNEARGWVEKRWNGELERDEWLLSARGRTREGVL